MSTDKRDGLAAPLSEGFAEVRLDTDVRGIVRRPGSAPDYVEITLDPERVRELVGAPVKGPGAAHRERWSLAGRIRFCRLRDYREAAGLSIADLSEATGLPGAVLEAIERDDEQATDRDRRIIAGALGADPDAVWPWTITDGQAAASTQSAPEPPAGVSTREPRPSQTERNEAQEQAERRQRAAMDAELADVRGDIERVSLRQGIENFRRRLAR